ncbi:unnamed protein product [Bursaphelenchus okinawaensis]|uniref:Uncharacterized protein n=1 Tax=Bursaphelenchus okinawaensis TaxID=465554 RepID=A0A811L6Y0_9BILA|nr:unnamed protein product [Bursaphelenchus okinawaensis]CAG9117836.1 unnamed protein product [Bursaphelenchus okinawaensis]
MSRIRTSSSEERAFVETRAPASSFFITRSPYGQHFEEGELDKSLYKIKIPDDKHDADGVRHNVEYEDISDAIDYDGGIQYSVDDDDGILHDESFGFGSMRNEHRSCRKDQYDHQKTRIQPDKHQKFRSQHDVHQKSKSQHDEHQKPRSQHDEKKEFGSQHGDNHDSRNLQNENQGLRSQHDEPHDFGIQNEFRYEARATCGASFDARSLSEDLSMLSITTPYPCDDGRGIGWDSEMHDISDAVFEVFGTPESTDFTDSDDFFSDSYECDAKLGEDGTHKVDDATNNNNNSIKQVKTGTRQPLNGTNPNQDGSNDYNITSRTSHLHDLAKNVESDTSVITNDATEESGSVFSTSTSESEQEKKEAMAL